MHSSDEGTPEPTPASSPCTCSCGGCCCHGSKLEPQHCVRCHRDYTFNHSEACTLPHVFDYASEECGDNLNSFAYSVCCGNREIAGAWQKGTVWTQPKPCFRGWHTIDTHAVEEQYNGVNILRCDPGPDQKCTRTQMKYPSARFKPLYNNQVKYLQIDKEDHRGHMKRKRAYYSNYYPDDWIRSMFNLDESYVWEDEEDEEDEEKGRTKKKSKVEN